MERHLAASHRIIPDDTLFIETIRAQLSRVIAGNSIITFLQRNVKRFFGFIHLDNLKVLYHFFRQKTFHQFYIRILFHRSLF